MKRGAWFDKSWKVLFALVGFESDGDGEFTKLIGHL